jgi:hypothetical protein
MRNKDQIILESLYDFVILERKNLEGGQEYIGKVASIHPVIKVGKGHPDYMKWAVAIEGEGYVGDVPTIHLENVESSLNHGIIDRTIRNEKDGKKAPVIKVKGIIKDINFPLSILSEKLSSGSWESVTYNPHKHPEYVYKDSLPSWWCEDPRFEDSRGDKNFIQNRIQAMKERLQDPEFSNIRILSQRSGNISSFRAKEAILKQHPKCDEDYMWVKGIQ